ncbi:MAG: polysaccharide export protein [Deltaproteobacteria bacterium]|nr:MAG: polysaccharide export protein [Deltaproteobacteria bacterium]
MSSSSARVGLLLLLCLPALSGMATCGAVPGAHGSDAGAGSTVPGMGAPADAEAEPAATTLGIGDVFEVRVFEEESLSGVFRVANDGSIDYPLCGRVRVLGMDSTAVSRTLTRCLKDGYLKDPQVSVFVREYNSKKIFVFGEVQKPGTFTYQDGMSVVEAITRAGGFTKVAAKNNVVITRVIDGREQKLRVPVEDIGIGRAPNFLLQPGDIVYVPESFF